MKSIRPVVHACIALMVAVFLALVASGQQAPASPTRKPSRSATTPKADRPLTNADVVKMVKAGLGDDIVITKIKGASTEGLDVSADGLVTLKDAGLSQPVIEAMMRRAGNPPGEPPAPAPAAEAKTSPPDQSAGLTAGAVASPVSLLSGGRSRPLGAVIGKPRRKLLVQYADFDGRGALIKEGVSQPQIRIQSDVDVRGLYYLVRCEVLEDRGIRTVKFGGKGRDPNEDFVVGLDVQQAPDGGWLVTPTSPLRRGEYGIFTSRATDRPGAPESIVMYEFGIDDALAAGAANQGGADTAAQGKALSNADVIAMTKADLGDDVIVAKIQQSPNANLDVTTEAMIALKKAGVSKAVITAMIKRADQRGLSRTSMSTSGPGAAGQTAAGTTRPVSILIKGAPVVIEPVAGIRRFVNAYVVRKAFFDFAGASAATRTVGPFVTVLIQSDLNPSAQYWFVRPKVLEDEDVRTLKVGSLKGAIAPDDDWTVPVDVGKRSEGLWAMTNRKNLKPGQYGIFKMGAADAAGSDLMFGFVVE